MTENDHLVGTTINRRDFLRTGITAAAGLATIGASAGIFAQTASGVRPGGSDTIRVGLIGAGDRGRGAAVNCFNAAPGIRLVAIGDVFQDHMDRTVNELSQQLGDAFDVPRERQFVGFDAYQKVIDSGVDLVILTEPPAFRPQHLRAAVEANKHVFMEKPACVDAVGARSVMESARMADERGLCIVAGTQRRHDPGYRATMERIRDGAIGELVGGQCYWNMGGLWVREPKPEWTEMELQLRNWLYYDWLSGDHIVEQHVHNIDIMNWAFGGPPERAMGMGGRQVRTAPIYGNIFDHFAVEFVYPGDVRVMSMCRQTDGTVWRVAERLVGTRGGCDPSGRIWGANDWSYGGPQADPYVQEHANLINAIRSNERINEARQVAESTLTAILGRTSAYTGQEVSYRWLLEASQQSLVPDTLEWGDHPINPVPVPGVTKLV